MHKNIIIIILNIYKRFIWSVCAEREEVKKVNNISEYLSMHFGKWD